MTSDGHRPSTARVAGTIKKGLERELRIELRRFKGLIVVQLRGCTWLATPRAVASIGLKPATLKKLRVMGGGPPPCEKFGGAVRYALAALDGWVAARVRTSTGHAGGAVE
jgi:hypothetical protein